MWKREVRDFLDCKALDKDGSSNQVSTDESLDRQTTSLGLCVIGETDLHPTGERQLLTSENGNAADPNKVETGLQYTLWRIRKSERGR